MRKLWQHLKDLFSETPNFESAEPFAVLKGHALVCPMCGRMTSHIKPRGWLHIDYWHGRASACSRSFITRGKRDRVFFGYTPEQRGEAGDD